jgi:hypothetical protein
MLKKRNQAESNIQHIQNIADITTQIYSARLIRGAIFGDIHEVSVASSAERACEIYIHAIERVTGDRLRVSTDFPPEKLRKIFADLSL